MFYRIGFVFLCFFSWTFCESVSNNLIKRNDIDLQTCIDNFNVHKDKIIRTQDSRDMGAKYLNEIDLGSREECLRLCCETEFCDVFVYEEKTPGSCYLFQCGPPEDFKCKFTQHANYSSAVLSINRGINELENQIKLTKHEQDLTRLRKTNIPNVRPTESKIAPSLVTVSTTTQKSREVLPIAPTKSPAGRRCNPYQFECRTSNECIAIYNACDGIPQCSDGSDEAAELGCPTEIGTTMRPQTLVQKNPALLPNNAFMQGAQLRKPLPHLIPDSYVSNVGNSRQISETHESDFVRPPDTRNNLQNFAEGPPQAFLPPRPIVQQNNQWLPQNVPPQYPEKNSHIFQHKENGLQVLSDSGGGSNGASIPNLGVGQQRVSDSAGGLQYGDINMRNDYKVPNYYNEVYRQQYPAENWQGNSQSRVDNNAYVPDNWPAQFAQQNSANEPNPPAYHSEADNLPSWKAELLNKNAESKTYDHTTIHEPKDLPEKKEHQKEQTKPVEEVKKPHEKHVHKTEHLKQSHNLDDLQDGESERPGGAILSLTLGVTITCVMAILVGCRLRMVKRRMLRRNGKSPYAHDADYLVNGMYL